MGSRIEETTVEQTAKAFAAELARWREVRGMSKRALAHAMGFDPSYVSHMESGRHKPSEDFARIADDALSAGKRIWRRWRDYEQARIRAGSARRALAACPAPHHPGQPHTCCSALVVEHDTAQLRYDGRLYRLTMRRLLRNTGGEPVTRYLIRVSVDRYPDDPEFSNAHYRTHPLTWDELRLTATCRRETMRWSVEQDRDAFKEVWLRFENARSRFPLYPGESVWIEYAYTVGDDKWGNWFQRAVRLPTERLDVELVFPAAFDPMVWGTETSMTTETAPLRTPPLRTDDGGLRSFTWTTAAPPLHARFCLEWRFRAYEALKDQAV
ncbi:helix-turn-helix domain-containing protein [Yinghuangia sp. ASG 101]|uniref:helix-turn-helix domain-containing protein n=1 Tax=Yinghuangia sp. ASG 101 TaxID=2896848 RepID=UPI001E3E989E|nr:helix-turn-helix transcriptional regulator [Yinghuangia sp. ASG 101]UGQ10416.1 helix-turn-helix domain-containing protein [Yinghuangia sp. ASG 101]